MSAEDHHTHGLAKQTLRLAFFLTLIIVAAEVTGGLLANSLALLSDAGHALTDLFALGLAWFAAAQADRPANRPLSECTPILIALETTLREKHRIGHTTFQFECSDHQGTCRDSDGLYCSMEEQEDLHDHRHEHTAKQDVSTERIRERQ